MAEQQAARKGKNISRQVPRGRAYIKATYNNTIITLTDLAGDVLAWSSSGKMGFKGPKKATPYAAGVVTKDAVDRAKQFGLEEVQVYVKGVGMGRESAVRSLHSHGLKIESIKDITPVPHNGCRPPKARQV